MLNNLRLVIHLITQQLFLLATHLFFDKANQAVTRELK